MKMPITDNFDRGYVVEFVNSADKGKTLAMVGLTTWLLQNAGYKSEEVIGNISYFVKGYTKYDNYNLRLKILEILKTEAKHMIIMCDEMEGVFPARFYQEKEQIKQLLGLWQCTKRRVWLLYTDHEGVGVDKMGRDATNFSIEPWVDLENDVIVLDKIINAIDKVPYMYRKEIYPASSVMGLYIRQEVVR